MKTGARRLLLLLGDVAMLPAAFFIMLSLAFAPQVTREVVESHLYPFSVVSVVWIFIFFLFNLYETRSVKPTIPGLRTIGIASGTSLAASAILFYAVPSFGITPKTNLLIFGVVFVCLFILWRRFFYNIFAKYFKRGVAFIVSGADGEGYVKELVEYIETYPQSGFFVTGIYSSPQEFFEKSQKKADLIILSIATLRNEDLEKFYNGGENILGLAYAYEDMLGKIPLNSIDETWFFHNLRSGGKIFYEVFTRVLNTIIALLVFVIVLPFLFMTALAIKLEDNGPIFYNRNRVGKGGKNFTLYKFRSMIIDADKGAQWTEINDSRITRVGKIIRRLHVDEGPQLLNVILGNMALVGPRPEIPSFAERLEREIPHYGLRHIILPGFTGWAQIKWRNARGVEESKQKFEYDLYYIKNRNIFMDLGIILRTIIIIFTHN